MVWMVTRPPMDLVAVAQADLSNTTGKGGLYFMPDGTQLSGISFFNVLAHY